MRGFPQFIKAIPEIISYNCNAIVQIAGEDDSYYGANVNKEGKKWKEWAVEFLENNNVSNNVKWIGMLPKTRYQGWIASSDCHITSHIHSSQVGA